MIDKYSKKAKKVIQEFKDKGWEMLEWTPIAMLMISIDRDRIITIKRNGVMLIGRDWYNRKVLGVHPLDTKAPIARF